MAWVTADGLVIKTVEQILSELAEYQRANLDPSVNTEPDEPLGQLNGTFASALREAWEVMQEAYDAFNPDAAEGTPLEKLCAITGTNRQAAAYSTVTCQCHANAGTTLLSGVHFANVTGDASNRWTPEEDFTFTYHATYDVVFRSEEAGAKVALSGTLTTINTPVSGWDTITNPLDATLGKEEDTDPELRVRRETELRASGSATCDAMRADLLSDDRMLQAQVFENVTDQTDANGLPPHAIECVVYDGTPAAMTDDEIAQAIWDTKGAGVQTYGTESGTAIDTLGAQHTIYFSRPTIKNVYLEFFIDVDSVLGYAGATALKTAVIAKGLEKLLTGRDVIANDYKAVAMGFAGVIDVTSLHLGFSASPSGTVNLVVGTRELAVLDTSRIDVTENPISPP